MPLFDMSINTQDVELSAMRKRAHSEFAKSDEIVKHQDLTEGLLQVKAPPNNSSENKENNHDQHAHVSSTPIALANSPVVKGSPGLTDSGSSPPEGNSPSPSATPTRAPLVQSTLSRFTTNVLPATPKPASLSSKTQTAKPTSSTSTSVEPPSKRKKLSPEEKAAREAAEAAERARKAEEKEQKRREKEEAEKQKAEEREQKRKEKEEADRQKRREKEEADRQKAAEKQRRQDEKEAKKREKEEEEAKKERSQKKLTSMFVRTAPVTPKKDKPVVISEKDQENGAVGTVAGATKEKTFYEQKFKPFYIKDHVKVADILSVDAETRTAKTKILEEWIEGKRGEFVAGPFNPRELCQLIRAPIPRGHVYPKVSKIMAEYHGDSNSTVPATELQIRNTREALKSVPVKSLKFREDVRPPYIGTVSGLPAGVKSLDKIARNPVRRDLLPLNYDYDSEAEWQEDDGEDVDDLDDEEEDLENDDDMDDFLDDSEDAGPARLLFSGGMEPESTGICWESDKFVNDGHKLEQYRLELMPEHLENHASIDPWNTEIYWPEKEEKRRARGKDENKTTGQSVSCTSAPPTKTGAELKAGSNEPNTTSSSIVTNSMAPPPVPADAFHALTSKTTEKKPAQKLPADAQEELKDLLRSKPDLSKVGIVEVFFANHKKKYPKTQIKATFEEMTEKAGKGWKLKDT